MANERKDRGGRVAASADGRTRNRKQARTSAEDAAEELPELSEQGGIEPTEESPADYHDRTRDRTLDES
ncbi:MAG: hypothetical protein ACRELT_10305 [Longimicrobiales bacterium]